MTPAPLRAHPSQRPRRPGALLAAAGLVLLSLAVTVLPAAALTCMYPHQMPPGQNGHRYSLPFCRESTEALFAPGMASQTTGPSV
jgi:hypothetical protein